MINLIFTGDTIDDGRRKINALLFTGITSTGYWSMLNTASTYFSLEISGLTNLYPTFNEDTSDLSNNIIIGTGNTISGVGGYNFVQGSGNYLASSKNTFASNEFNNLTGLTNSFIFGIGNDIYTGNSITIIGGTNNVLSANTLRNDFNYVTILGASLNTISKKSIFDENDYLSIFNNNSSSITGATKFVSILPGSSNILSGTVTNSSIFGYSNSIGYYDISINDIQDNIFIFGQNLKPIPSQGTLIPYSGTYINDLCIENNLILNYKYVVLDDILNPSKVKSINLHENNIIIISGSGTGNWTIEPQDALNDMSGLFFVNYFNNKQIKSASGNTLYVIDDYSTFPYNSRWDMPTNALSANTVFMTRLKIGRYIRYKG